MRQIAEFFKRKSGTRWHLDHVAGMKQIDDLVLEYQQGQTTFIL
jgi:Uri superfamily endonuclease